MTIRISHRELEAISAYLDGQLSPRERARLESRLQVNQDLHMALEQLRRTRALLRSLPAMRAPRNYVLTPQMVRPRKPAPRSYPVLRLVSVMASLLFALVLLGDFLGLGPSRALPQVAAVREEPAAEVMEAPAEAGEMTVESGAPAAEPEEAQKSMAAGEPETPSPEGTPGGLEFLLATPDAELAVPLAPHPSMGLHAQAAASAQPDPPRQAPADLNPLRMLEVVFGVVAVLTGLAALLVRRGVNG